MSYVESFALVSRAAYSQAMAILSPPLPQPASGSTIAAPSTELEPAWSSVSTLGSDSASLGAAGVVIAAVVSAAKARLPPAQAPDWLLALILAGAVRQAGALERRGEPLKEYACSMETRLSLFLDALMPAVGQTLHGLGSGGAVLEPAAIGSLSTAAETASRDGNEKVMPSHVSSVADFLDGRALLHLLDELQRSETACLSKEESAAFRDLCRACKVDPAALEASVRSLSQARAPPAHKEVVICPPTDSLPDREPAASEAPFSLSAVRSVDMERMRGVPLVRTVFPELGAGERSKSGGCGCFLFSMDRLGPILERGRSRDGGVMSTMVAAGRGSA